MKYNVFYYKGKWIQITGEFIYTEAKYWQKILLKENIVNSKLETKIVPIIFNNIMDFMFSPGEQIIVNKLPRGKYND